MDKTEFMAIKDARDGLKNVNVMFIVLELTASTKTKENREVFSFKVADQSAAINCSIWDEPGKLLQPGDIVRMMKCYVSLWRGCLTLYSGKSGEILKMGDFCLAFNEQINMSDPLANQPTVPQPTVPVINNGTNGNGRSKVSNSSQSTPQAPSVGNSYSSTSSDIPKPKVGNSNARNNVRRPANKK